MRFLSILVLVCSMTVAVFAQTVVYTVHLPLVVTRPTLTPTPSATPTPQPTAIPWIPPWRRDGNGFVQLTVTDVELLASSSSRVAVRNDTNRVVSDIVVSRAYYTSSGVYVTELFTNYSTARLAPGETRRFILLAPGTQNGNTIRIEAYGFPVPLP